MEWSARAIERPGTGKRITATHREGGPPSERVTVHRALRYFAFFSFSAVLGFLSCLPLPFALSPISAPPLAAVAGEPRPPTRGTISDGAGQMATAPLRLPYHIRTGRERLADGPTCCRVIAPLACGRARGYHVRT